MNLISMSTRLCWRVLVFLGCNRALQHHRETFFTDLLSKQTLTHRMPPDSSLVVDKLIVRECLSRRAFVLLVGKFRQSAEETKGDE